MLVTTWEEEESLTRSELDEASAIALAALVFRTRPEEEEEEVLVTGGEVVGILFSLVEAAVGLPIC